MTATLILPAPVVAALTCTVMASQWTELLVERLFAVYYVDRRKKLGLHFHELSVISHLLDSLRAAG